jgi:peptide/nickel transport system substrate-binding protein
VGKIMRGEFAVTTWGYPWRDPEPLIYQNFHSGLPQNLGRYSNPIVDAALDAGRRSNDVTVRAAEYAKAFTQFAKDVPFIPIVNPEQGYIFNAKIRGGVPWEDGTVRPDLLSRVR